MADARIAVLFVHGVGIREPDYARTAVAQLRAQFRAATNDERADDDLIIESAYWAPAVLARQDRLSERTVPGFASGWFGAMDRLTQKVATGSTLSSRYATALSGLVRRPGDPQDPLADPALGGDQLRRRRGRLPGLPAQSRGLRRGARRGGQGAGPAGRAGAGRAAVRGRAQAWAA
ncbi:MAG: hypothetical protein U0R72_12915 [Nakamurella multipartita]